MINYNLKTKIYNNFIKLNKREEKSHNKPRGYRLNRLTHIEIKLNLYVRI
jgi:hypothetical protein